MADKQETKLANKTGVQNITFTWLWATHLSGWLHRNGQGIKSIELFGSLARGEGGMDSDFDLIIVVDGFTAARWFYDVRDELDMDPFYGFAASTRREKAFKALKLDDDQLEDGTGVKSTKLDIFLFPPNWRDRLDELQVLGSHRDPNFMRNIARDARTFVQDQGFPFPVIVP